MQAKHLAALDASDPALTYGGNLHQPNQRQNRRYRHMAGITFLLSVALLWFGTTRAMADVIISSDTSGISGSTSYYPQGDIITTPAGGPWDDLTFNFYFYNGSLNPSASGDLYIFTTPVTENVGSISSSDPGFLAMASASGNLWTFATGVELDPDTTYYFYNTTASSDEYGSGDAGVYAPLGGSFEPAGLTVDYSLAGDVAAVPEPGSFSLLLMAIGVLGLVAGGKNLRRNHPAIGT